MLSLVRGTCILSAVLYRKLNAGFLGGAVVRNLPANIGDAREGGLIPG